VRENTVVVPTGSLPKVWMWERQNISSFKARVATSACPTGNPDAHICVVGGGWLYRRGRPGPYPHDPSIRSAPGSRRLLSRFHQHTGQLSLRVATSGRTGMPDGYQTLRVAGIRIRMATRKQKRGLLLTLQYSLFLSGQCARKGLLQRSTHLMRSLF
jgi:hypothetical protein